jgi:serine-type D-Ala-D-Ala carboxypeptidase/endopeptidase
MLGLRSAPWFTGTDLGGAGAVRSSITDMLRYLEANMRPAGTPLEQALRAAQQELYRGADGMNSGMFWVRMEGQTLRETVLWHNGGTGGFRSFLGWTEKTGVGVVVLSNSGESVDELALELLREIALSHAEIAR